ncbi:MAG: DUF1080 domain-containing protein [Sedimentisphaerales bacterium]|nr:DUF1080 domain-containing protein [Sedimentisphaerales bacterium]
MIDLYQNTDFIRLSFSSKTVFTIIIIFTFALAVSCRKTTPSSAGHDKSGVSKEQIRSEKTDSKKVASTETNDSEKMRKTEPNKPRQTITEQTSLFDGNSLGQWAVIDFGGQGKVYVKDGAIYMEMGNDMTGIKWKGPLIRMDYEITLEAMRVGGSDFFCGLTFPVAEKPCSLILGGWGGGVCGLSNIDYYDAANNETSRYVSFEDNKWYKVRLRVTSDRIQAWLDDEELVNIETTGRKIDIRAEMDLAVPLGIATWQTSGAVRNIKIKPIEKTQKIIG